MSNDYQLSNSIPIFIFLVKEMVINDGFTNFDILLKKFLRYQHHCKNYEDNMTLDLIPKGFQIKERHAFEPVSKDFNIKWNNILRDAERNLIELLRNQSSKVVERVELDLDLELERVYPENYDNKRLQLDQKHQKFQKNVEKRRLKKWNNVKQKQILSERILVGYNTAENLDIKRKNMQEDSKFADFPKNLQNVTDNTEYRKKGTKIYSDAVKSVDLSTEEAPENSKTIVDLRNIQSILLREEVS